MRREFAGRVVDADSGGPVGNVRISLRSIAGGGLLQTGFSKDTATATSAADGTFTLSLDLPSSWQRVWLDLTGPPGYDDGDQVFERTTPANRPTVRIYPTLVIRWSLGDMSVRRLMVPSGGIAYVLGTGTARLTARR